jgi:hypothetical protein
MSLYNPPRQLVIRGMLTSTFFVANRWGVTIVQKESWNTANGAPVSSRQKQVLEGTNKYRKRLPHGPVRLT